MRNLTPTSITQAFADYARNAPSERARAAISPKMPATPNTNARCAGWHRDSSA